MRRVEALYALSMNPFLAFLLVGAALQGALAPLLLPWQLSLLLVLQSKKTLDFRCVCAGDNGAFAVGKCRQHLATNV